MAALGNERLLDPAAEHPLAHGGAGLVQHPEQRSPLFAAPQRLGQLEICPGDRRQAHELSFIVCDDRFQALDAFNLRIMENIPAARPLQSGQGRLL